MKMPETHRELEVALYDLAKATDGAGLHIVLHRECHPDFLTDTLRREIREHMRKGIRDGTAFIDLNGVSVPAEIAYWRNLALLANALAASLTVEST